MATNFGCEIGEIGNGLPNFIRRVDIAKRNIDQGRI